MSHLKHEPFNMKTRFYWELKYLLHAEYKVGMHFFSNKNQPYKLLSTKQKKEKKKTKCVPGYPFKHSFNINQTLSLVLHLLCI